MKFKIEDNKFFYSIIGGIICIGLIASFVLRNSIKKYDFNDFNQEKENYIYNPFISYNTGDEDSDEMEKYKNIDMENLSEYIVKGKAEGTRKLVDSYILTKVQVSDVIKGSIDSKEIYIYEPVAVIKNSEKNKIVSALEGYNLIQDNKEYFFCLNKAGDDLHYSYANPFTAKFPIENNDSDFKVIDEKKVDSKITYDEYSRNEQLFPSEEHKKLYDDYKEKLFAYIYHK